MEETKKINFVLDVDGVMTTGHFIYSLEGKKYKIFGPHDSDGLKRIQKFVNVHFISADKRGFGISKKRIHNDMGFPVTLVTEEGKFDFVKEKFGLKNTIYMGDGLNDVQILRNCKFGIAPANARIEAKKAARFVTRSSAANGAVCDACMEIGRRIQNGKL